jgi:hypothetical protein
MAKNLHRHKWPDHDKYLNQDERRMSCGKVPDGKKGLRCRQINDDFPQIRECSCGRREIIHVPTNSWHKLIDEAGTYGMERRTD